MGKVLDSDYLYTVSLLNGHAANNGELDNLLQSQLKSTDQTPFQCLQLDTNDDCGACREL